MKKRVYDIIADIIGMLCLLGFIAVIAWATSPQFFSPCEQRSTIELCMPKGEK